MRGCVCVWSDNSVLSQTCSVNKQLVALATCAPTQHVPTKATGVLSVIRSWLEEIIKQMNVGEKVMCCLRKR